MLIRSFRHALRGLVVAFRTEQSFRIQTICGVIAVLLGALLQVSALEFVALLFVIAAVLVLELVNSVLERLVDAFKPRLHPIVRDAKDVMAGAVLIASFMAAAVGSVILLPHLFALVA